MARRRKIEIEAKELKCFDHLVAELMRHPAFADFDVKSVRISAYESYEPVILNAKRAVYNIDLYESCNRGTIETINGHQLFGRSDLARILKVSRPTIDKWVADGFLDGCTVRLAASLECYQLPLVRQKLTAYIAKHKD